MPRDPPRFFIQASPDLSIASPPQTPHTPGASGHAAHHAASSSASFSSALTWPEPDPDPHSFPFPISGRTTPYPHHDHMSGAKIDALADIHRVLYRGREGDERVVQWEEQSKEVQRVVEKWFEGDCVYDHPLARVSSRQSLLAHFILLNLLSTMYLPTLTPSSLVHHVRQVVGRVASSVASATSVAGVAGVNATGTEKENETDRALMTGGEEERLGLTADSARAVADDVGGEMGQNRNWWRLYDVSADCKEMGAMESYDGYHLAMIEQETHENPEYPSLSSRETHAPSSFTKRLALVILDEISDVLRWDIPISTTVHFNEVGKATHIRDTIDVRDLIESFVPFAKRISWLTRRLSGVLTSTLGAIAMKSVQDRESQRQRERGSDERGLPAYESTKLRPVSSALADKEKTAGFAQLAEKQPSSMRPHPYPSQQRRDDALGLDGINKPMTRSTTCSGAAPDSNGALW